MTAAKAKVNILRQDWLLIIAIILAPMTELRIWKVGPAEALCLLWCILQCRHVLSIRIKDPFLIFWALFLCVTLLGTCYGEWFYPDQSNISGLLTWCYFALISLATYAGLKQRGLDQLLAVLIWASCAATVWYLFLYLYSLYVSPYFLGTNLWYGNLYRFSGGASNPHQVAMLLCVIVLVLVCVAFEREKGIRRWGMLLLAGAAAFLLSETRSTTAIAAAVCGLCLAAVMLLFRTVLRRRWARIVFFAFLIVFFLIFAESLYNWFMYWISTDSNGLERLDLIAQFPDTFWKSPIFGLGPGVHVTGGEATEFHNTYLEVFAMSGLIGMVVFLWFSVILFKKIFRAPCSLAVVTALYVYGLAGFGMRRLTYWIMISFAFLIAEKRCCDDGQIACNKIE